MSLLGRRQRPIGSVAEHLLGSSSFKGSQVAGDLVPSGNGEDTPDPDQPRVFPAGPWPFASNRHHHSLFTERKKAMEKTRAFFPPRASQPKPPSLPPELGVKVSPPSAQKGVCDSLNPPQGVPRQRWPLLQLLQGWIISPLWEQQGKVRRLSLAKRRGEAAQPGSLVGVCEGR